MTALLLPPPPPMLLLLLLPRLTLPPLLGCSPECSQVLLNDTDPLWARLKNFHIADLGTTLHAEFKAFVAQHPDAAALSKGGDKGIKQITEGLRHLPKFKEQSERYSMYRRRGSNPVGLATRVAPRSFAPCSLLLAPCSLLLAPCSSLLAPCSLLLAPCSLLATALCSLRSLL